MRWRILETGRRSVYYNMAVDEALFSCLKHGDNYPVIRFYRWEKPCITIGYFQSIPALKRIFSLQGINYVRRMTGGGAVLHGTDLAISIICRYQDINSKNTLESYNKISSAIASGISCLDPAIRVEKEGSFFSNLCFNAPQPGDIVCNSKKLAGGAQRRSRGYLLYQGSILVSKPCKEIVLQGKNISIEEITSKEIKIKNLEQLIISGIQKQFKINTEESSLSKKEIIFAKKIEKKYRSRAWSSLY